MRRLAPLAIVLAAGLPLLAGGPAAAQGLSSGGIAGGGFKPITGVGPKQNRTEPAPPGLPGASPRSPVAPTELQLDVPPTDALFDAINRGDISSAREALNRGADIYGRNVLGMTPLDLSVDLSRNDITFLLMSMRGQASVSGPPASAPPPPPIRADKRGAAKAPAKSRPAAAPAAVAANGAGQPVRFASVPANPVPQAGFLGFGAAATP